jgi:hypothetical protein
VSSHFAGSVNKAALQLLRLMCVHCRGCRVSDVVRPGATSGDGEIWLSVCSEANGVVHKRADVCRRRVCGWDVR